ncbi:MAG: MFS transporter [Actinomycetota bacterium]|nr:MFS transporter [Actinomycetota bacterium]
MAVVCGAPFLASLDLFVVNVAFPDIGVSLPTASLADLSWVLNAYAIVYAALLVPMGRWADRIGHKRVFVIGLITFTLASAAAATSTSLWWLVGLRVVQALGASAVIPSSLGLLLHAVAPEKRVIAVKLWGAVSAIAAAAGPVVGGLLVELSWRWVFLINVPLGVLLVWAALRVLDGYRAEDADPDLDLSGAVLLALGVGAVTLGLVQGPRWGWGSLAGIVTVAVAVVCLGGFGINNGLKSRPLLPPAMLRIRSFAWSNLTMVAFGATFGAGLLILVLWLQDVWGYSAIQAGLAIAPGPLVVPFAAVAAQQLTERVAPGWLAALGCLLYGVGNVLILVSVDPQAQNYAAAVLPGWMIAGLGVGLALPIILSSATAELPETQSATGSAVVNMARQLGIALGIAVLVALLGDTSGVSAVGGFTAGWWTIVAIAALAAVTSPAMSPRQSEQATIAKGAAFSGPPRADGVSRRQKESREHRPVE